MDIEAMFALLTFMALFFVFILWMLCDEQDRRAYKPCSSASNVFYCSHCDHIYQGPSTTDVENCPRCSQGNACLRFR
jgi:hypothetical protein